ncbi:hypothetical protein ACH9DO_09715 [Kocuria sp. M1N1S27]|uniref:hypothetical protein n=1 Tax=Kocuria kalidii TaxID=3376283 RepID=UPI00379F7DDE
MTEHAGPGPAPVVPHGRRPDLRVVGGTAVEPAGTEDERRRARAAAARAAHPSSGLGVPGFQRPQPAAGPGRDGASKPGEPAAAAPGDDEQNDRPDGHQGDRQGDQGAGVPVLDGIGPHTVTGAVLLPAARSGDALKVEVLAVVDPDPCAGPLEAGCTAYLPVRADGAAFCPRELHRALGAAGRPLCGTFRVTVCRAGGRDVPSVAHRQPFAETDEHWIVVGRSGTEGADDERTFCLTAAMQRAVSAGVDFLAGDRGMDRPIAQAYLSTAAEFAVTRLEDSSVGAHGRIRKADFS